MSLGKHLKIKLPSSLLPFDLEDNFSAVAFLLRPQRKSHVPGPKIRWFHWKLESLRDPKFAMLSIELYFPFPFRSFLWSCPCYTNSQAVNWLPPPNASWLHEVFPQQKLPVSKRLGIPHGQARMSTTLGLFNIKDDLRGFLHRNLGIWDARGVVGQIQFLGGKNLGLIMVCGRSDSHFWAHFHFQVGHHHVFSLKTSISTLSPSKNCLDTACGRSAFVPFFRPKILA